MPAEEVFNAGIALIDKAFKKTKSLIKGLKYKCFNNTNVVKSNSPISNNIKNYQFQEIMKKMKKTEQADRTNVLNTKTSISSNPFAPLFIQELNDNQEIKATSNEPIVAVLAESSLSFLGDKTDDALIALGYCLELEKITAVKLRDALYDLRLNTIDKAARWLKCRAVVDYGSSKMTLGCIKEAEFCLLIRKENQFQAVKPRNERGYNEKIKFEKRRNIILAILDLKNVDEIQDEVDRVFVRKTKTDLNNLWNKFNWECELRDEFSVRKAAGDGACLFNSLCMAVGLEPQLHSKNLREIICDGLEDDLETSSKFDSIMNGQKLEDYVKNMRLPGTYGSHIEIMMFNKIFGAGVTIYIVGPDNVGKKIEDEWGKEDIIYLKLTTHSNSNLNHYDMLSRNGDIQSDRVRNRILTRIACKNDSIGKIEEEIQTSYLRNNFTEREAAHGGNNCVFEAICNSFQTLNLLYIQVRNFLTNLTCDDDIDRYAQYHLCKKVYEKIMTVGKGGDFEFMLLARWARCKIIIFETWQLRIKKVAIQIDGHNDFTLFFERKHLDYGLHVVALTPISNEYYVDYGKFKNKSKELNEILIGMMIGGSIADNIDKVEKELIKQNEEGDSNFGNSIIDGLIDEIDQIRKNDEIIPDEIIKVDNHNEADNKHNQDEDLLIEDIGKEAHFIRANTVEEAMIKWNSSVKADPKKPSITALEYRKAFGLDILPKFEDYKDELRDEALNEDNVRELRKNIQTEDEYEIEMITKRFVIPERVQKLIGPCICIKCSSIMENGKAAFRLWDTFYDLKEHAKRSHDRKLPADCIINANFPDSAKVHMIKGGNWRQYFLMEPIETEQKEIPNEGPKKIREVKDPNMDNVEIIDKEDVEFKEKKPSFNFIIDPIEVPKGSKLSYELEIKCNKDLALREEKLSADFMASTYKWDDFKNICKNKREHNRCPDDDLLRFRDTLPKNVRLDKNIASSSFFKRDTDFSDGTTKVIGPCLDIDCSGLNYSGKPIYRIFNTLFELKKHGGRNKLHMLNMGCILNLEKPEGWQYYKIKNGNTTYYYMKKSEDDDNKPEKKKNKGNKAGDYHMNPICISDNLHIIGHNSTTLCSKENKDLFNVYLNDLYNEDKVAILLLNEVGKVDNIKLFDRSLRDKYAIMGTGTRTAIVYDKRLRVNMVMDKLNDDHNQIAVVTNLKNKKLIIYNVYVAPGADHRARLDSAKFRLRTILERFKDAKIVIFGDFNLKRNEMKKEFLSDFKDKGITCYMDTNINSFTRCRKVLETIQYNYLDYIITFGIGSSKFGISKPIAKSDHMTLKLEVANSELGDVIVKKELRYDFNGPKNDSALISKRLIEIFTGQNGIKDLVYLVNELREKYKPKCKKVKKCFTFKDIVERLISEKANWKEFGKAIRKISNEEYSNFMLDIADLKIKRNLKEYFMKMRFYSEISRSASTMTNLEEIIPDEDMINLITSKIEIDEKVYDKYSKMFDDNGTKEIYPPINQETMTINDWEIAIAFNNISFEKAISWDYIPGISFKDIYNLKDKDKISFDKCCNGIAKLLTELLKGDNPIPEELFCARLLCLNKCPESNGKLENIRPISIIGVLMKIMERVIQSRVEIYESLNNIKISKSQVGFVKGLGCDVNIMRLRQRVYDLKFLRTKEEKYVFFIDLKAAYDSVNHQKLFLKMEKKGYSPEIINAIRVIYSSARMRLNTLQRHINVNRGVLQGGILSPWLFNIYIDDLVRSLKEVSFEILAYADDLAVICKNKQELDKVIDILENWATTNEIAVNKKKSGILIVDNDRNNMHQYKGYPIRVTYKYLGMKLNNQLNPLSGLEETKKKLDVFLMRNNWINRFTLTPKSLINLSMYYQRSRVIYGMSCFLDMKNIIDSVERGNLKYTKSILGLSNQVNSDRLRIILNRPLDRHCLWVLMRKNMRKYMNHFNDEPWIYNKINLEYEKWLSNLAGKENLAKMIEIEKIDYGKFKWSVGDYSIKSLAIEDNLEIADHYRGTHNKKYFMAWDKRDGHMIRYLVNHGFYKARFIPRCEHCGEENSRTHVTNICPAFDNLRTSTWKQLNELRKTKVKIEDRYKGDLEKAFLDAYFKPRSNCQKELEVLKRFSIQLAIANSKISKRE